MRANFLVVGAQKAGTSALDTYLRQHPQVCMARMKEVHFFDDERRFSRWAWGYSDYHKHFPPLRGRLAVGESTPLYMYWRDAPRRIRRYNPGMKLIAVLRNPIDRAYSHWNMERLRDVEDKPFLEALQWEARRAKAALPLQDRVFSYVDRGLYCDQLRRLWTFFPRKQVYVIRYEMLREHPGQTMEGVFRFLGIEMGDFGGAQEVYSHPYPAPMEQSEHSYLRERFESEIRALEQLLGWDCESWLAVPPASPSVPSTFQP